MAIAARSRGQVTSVAGEIGGIALELDVSGRGRGRERSGREERGLGPLDLLVANAGIGGPEGETWEVDAEEWWRVFEVNVLGVHVCCRAVIPRMLERGRGRIVITGSGARICPREQHRLYREQGGGRALCRDARERALGERLPVFVISPGLVQTAMTGGFFDDDAPWTPPELAPQLVRVLASGRAERSLGGTSTPSTTTSRT